MGYRFLGASNGFGTAFDMAPDDVSAQIPVAIVPLMFKIKSTTIGRFMKKIDIFRKLVPVSGSYNAAHKGIFVIKIFLDPAHKIVGQGLYYFPSSNTGIINMGIFSGRGAFQYTDGPTILGLSAKLGSPQNIRIVWLVYKFAIYGIRVSLRASSNTPGIKQIVGAKS